MAAARKTGEWDGLGGWREAVEDEIERAFVHFGSTKVSQLARGETQSGYTGRARPTRFI